MKKWLSFCGLSLFLLGYSSIAVAQSIDPGSPSPATTTTASPLPNSDCVPDCGPIDRVPTLPQDPDGD